MRDRAGPELQSIWAAGLLRHGRGIAATGIAELVREATDEPQKRVGLESGRPGGMDGAAKGGAGAGSGGIAMRDGACLGVQERLAALEPLTAAETVHLTQCPGCARLMSRRDRLAEAFEFACPEPASVDGRGAALDSETRPVGHALRAEVEAQPPAQRMAILLCYGHGLDTAEIAGLLGVGVGTVRTLLVWGLEGLQDDAGPGVGAGARAGAGAEVR